MKRRSSEAAHLESEYLRRVQAAVAGGDAAAIDDVLEAVREHIEEELAHVEGDQVTLVQMATVLERLGPPETYADDMGEAIAAPASSPAAADHPPAAPAPLTIGECLADAMRLYRQNLVILVVAAFLYDIISIASLLILAAPLWGGIAWMMVKARRRADGVADLADMFGTFNRFWPLLGLFIIETVCVLVGLSLFIVPGVLLITIWLYSELVMVDQQKGVFESMGISSRMVSTSGWGLNLGLAAIVCALVFGPLFIPYVGIVVGWFASPIAWALAASAYVRQVDACAARPALTADSGTPIALA